MPRLAAPVDAGVMDQSQLRHESLATKVFEIVRNAIVLGEFAPGSLHSVQEIAEKLKQFSSKRWTSQPAAPSAGCIFKNPGPIPAGKLIDELGLKNLSVGSARVSEVHGNFIVNDGGATAEDVLQLIAIIQSRARESRQIDLNTEVIVLGEEN